MAGKVTEKGWCKERLGIECLLDEYPEWRHRCVTGGLRPCEFGELMETIDRLPLEVRLEVLRKLLRLQQEKLREELGED